MIEMDPAEIMEVFEIRTSLETQILRKILRNQMIKEKISTADRDCLEMNGWREFVVVMKRIRSFC